MPQSDHSIIQQFAVFIGVGTACAILDVSVMQALILWGIPLLIATSLGFVAGLAVNFMAHARMTFSTTINWQSWWKYLVVVALNYVLTLVSVGLFTHWFESPMTGKLISLPLVALNGYGLSRFWVFK